MKIIDTQNMGLCSGSTPGFELKVGPNIGPMPFLFSEFEIFELPFSFFNKGASRLNSHHMRLGIEA